MSDNKIKQLREQYEELCYENDEINRKWAEDNERNGDILSELQEQIKQLKLELLMTKEESETYEKQNNEWFKICGCDGLIQDLFYNGYHETKLINGEVDEVYKAITEMKNKIYKLHQEIESLQEEKEELKSEADRWEGEHSDLWYSVFGALDDGGYPATSTGQLISFIRDIIKENEKLKEENEKIGLMLDEERNEKDRNEGL
tara:strand:- start:2131 stop:2736 length:606 start_codon:yes stop_codon:yes gene_type:complete